MAVPEYIKGERLYYLPSVDFGNGKKSIQAVFSDSLNTSLGDIYIDSEKGEHIGVIAFSNGKKVNTASCDIKPTCGIHNVYIKIKGYVTVSDVEFKDDSPFDVCDYVPVPAENLIDNAHDTWEATDMLGRKVPSVEDVGRKKDRKVGIFYWTWREHAVGLTPVNVSKLLEEFPAAEYNRDHPGWISKSIQPHWNEPRYGFYRNSDPYVIRHHAVLLANAGVDFLLFDCTNGALLWRDAYEPLLEGFYQARKDGIKTPQIAFMLNFGPSETSEAMLRAMYQNIYKPGKYSDMWFRLDGKPMVMAYKESLPAVGKSDFDTALLDEIRNYFSFRAGQPLYGGPNGGEKRPDHWGWLEKFPQHKFGLREDGSCEMMTVGVGQNCNDEMICTHFNNKDTYGRSYTHKYGQGLVSKDSYKYGYNVQEQWERALDVDPDIVFITGWNEWMMGLFKDPWIQDKNSTQLAMVDQYDREHSRDIEPDKDGYLDTYYLQLAANIRRYKGAGQRTKASEPKTVNSISDFDSVTPYYRADKGITIHRDYPGFGDTWYKNDSGRNEIIGAKVARDNDYAWFYAECSKPLTSPSKEGWMTLFIDTDRNKKTGWEGYDIAVNRTAPKDGKTDVEVYFPTAEPNSFSWKKIGQAEVTVDGNKLVIKLPRELLGGKLGFEFKWSDNMQSPEAIDFYENGCSAPFGRFNYLFEE